jgi:hypothetical protein
MSAKERVEGRNGFAERQLKPGTIYEVQGYASWSGWLVLVNPNNGYNANQFKKVVEKIVTLAPWDTFTNNTDLPATLTYYEDE